METQGYKRTGSRENPLPCICLHAVLQWKAIQRVLENQDCELLVLIHDGACYSDFSICEAPLLDRCWEHCRASTPKAQQGRWQIQVSNIHDGRLPQQMDS